MGAWVRCALFAAAAGPLAAQEPPRFAAQAEAITVDVVVLDGDGLPVRGLTRADFTLSEDGKPQAIVGFEARALDPDVVPATGAAVPAAPASSASGRAFAVVIDDLGLSPSEVLATRAALQRWIGERADSRDQLTLLTTTVAAPASDALVPASDARVAVTGRVVRTSEGAVRVGYPGVALRVRFEGASLAVRTDATTPDVYFDVSVDGAPPRAVRLPAGPADVPLAERLAPGPHAVALVHRNETWQGVVAVAGFVTDGRLLTPDPPPARRILFLGDSVTCGENVDRAAGACRKDASNWDADGSYGMRLARALGAEAHLVCHGGRGVVRDWQGRTDVANAPAFLELAVPVDGGPTWDHAAWTPDVVVVSLGTNDFSASAGPLPEREAWVAAYVALLRRVRALHPSAGVVLTEGAIVSDDDPARPARTTLRAYIDEAVARLGDPRIVHAPSARFPGDACDAHPTADQHAAMARELEPAVRALAGW